MRKPMPNHRWCGKLTWALVATAYLAASAGYARTQGNVNTAPTDPVTAGTETPESTPSVAPPDTREVLAEGRAAIGKGGLEGARKTALAHALRTAVEKTTGVYVSARTLTHNYQLVKDQVVTHADGYAAAEEIVREVDEPQLVKITIRARVSLRPLAQQLKALNLTRKWRVRVHLDADGGDGSREAVATALERSLADAGLVVVSSDDEADIVAQVTRRFDDAARPARRTRFSAQDAPFVASGGPIRGVVTVRATLAQTGEVVAALNAAGTAQSSGPDAARADAAAEAAAALAPKLTDALLLLPAREAQPVELIVGKIGSAARASHFEDRLNGLVGVTSVTRRRYENGNAIWELQVLSDAQGEIARSLEEDPALKPYRLTVISDTLVKIIAATNGIAPVFKPMTSGVRTDAAPDQTPRLPIAVATANVAYAPNRPVKLSAPNPAGAMTINPADSAAMVWIPAGPFVMGDNDDAIRDRTSGIRNNPRHTVYLAGYYISRNLVTVAQYRKFCSATHHQMPMPPPWGWRDDHPIVDVNWDDARAYCEWAGVRLPTEAEWEKAARGPDGNRYPWGNDFAPQNIAYARAGDAPAGAFEAGASPYGVLDMAGNVWEWCADWYQLSYLTEAQPDSLTGRTLPRRRVLRGGSWHETDASTFRSAFRSKNDPRTRSDNVGFRTVLAPW